MALIEVEDLRLNLEGLEHAGPSDTQDELLLDARAPAAAWFHDPIEAREPMWTTPHTDERSGALVTELSAPFFAANGAKGAVFARRAIGDLTDVPVAEQRRELVL